MQDLAKLFLFLAVAALFTSGIAAGTPIFADDDDEKKKKNKVLTGEGPPRDKLGKKGDGYIDNASENCDYYIKTEKKIWTLSETLCEDPGTGGDLEARVSVLEQFVQDVMNGVANLVSWNSLKDVPADIADGDDVDDADNDPNNEIQSLSLSGQDLSISGGNTVTLPSDAGDNLGDHMATQILDMKGFDVSNAPNIDANTVSIVTKITDPGCSTDQIIKWDGVTWVCTDDQIGGSGGVIHGTVHDEHNVQELANPNLGPKTILTNSFTLNNDASVTVSGRVSIKNVSLDTAFLKLYFDGTLVQTQSNEKNGLGAFYPSWVGQLSSGPHTITVEVFSENSALYCPNVPSSPPRCYLDTMYIEH